jgi:hypothetical protein
VCASFHDLGLLKKFSSAEDCFEVDSANAVRQFLEHHGVPDVRIQTARDAIALHTTPGIAAYKPLEVELLYNGVGLDVLGIGYENLPSDLREKIVDVNSTDTRPLRRGSKDSAGPGECEVVLLLRCPDARRAETD